MNYEDVLNELDGLSEEKFNESAAFYANIGKTENHGIDKWGEYGII